MQSEHTNGTAPAPIVVGELEVSPAVEEEEVKASTESLQQSSTPSAIIIPAQEIEVETIGEATTTTTVTTPQVVQTPTRGRSSAAAAAAA